MYRSKLANSFTPLLLVGAVVLGACDSSKTDSGGAPDSDSQFVATESNSGGLTLNVNSTRVPVAGTTSFSVEVRDANGMPVPQIQVACDSEQGIAILEPSTGLELTDSFGNMSGVIGCEFPGSYQFACRLPVGANRRKFENIVCTGDVPTGFSGFPGSAGGGLGGGLDVIEDDNNGFSIRLTSIVFTDAGQETTSIDSTFDTDCDNDGVADDPETFTDTTVTFTVENNSTQIVRITDYRYLVQDFGLGGSYETPWISLIGEQGSSLDSEGGSAAFSALFMDAHQGSKRYFGRTDSVADYGEDGEGFKNITFSLRGTTSAGEPITLTARTAISVDNFNNCGGV